MKLRTASIVTGSGFLPVLFLVLAGGTGLGNAQITNGVFDPSKVMVATEKVKELQSFQQNIILSNEFNRTLGTPDHPRPPLPPGQGPPPNQPPRYGPEPVPSFEVPTKKRRFRRKTPPSPFESPPVNSRNGGPAVEASSLVEGPSVEATPATTGGPSSSAPEQEAGLIGPPQLPPGSASVDSGTLQPVSINTSPEVSSSERKGLFNRLRKSRSEDPADLGLTGESNLPPSDSSSETADGTAATEQTASDLSNDFNSIDGTNVASNGMLLPSYSSTPDGNTIGGNGGNRAGGFLKRIGKGKSGRKSFDVPSRPIPISVGSAGTGNPYADRSFSASSGYSPLLDDRSSIEEVRDMTQSGARPLPAGSTGIAERGPQKSNADTSQYFVVRREGLVFQPFQPGSEVPDPDFSYDLYSGAVVKSLGLSGTKRRVMTDSGETGLVAKDGVRPLSVSEKSTMEIGLAAGRPWYSILDTDPEVN